MGEGSIGTLRPDERLCLKENAISLTPNATSVRTPSIRSR